MPEGGRAITNARALAGEALNCPHQAGRRAPRVEYRLRRRRGRLQRGQIPGGHQGEMAWRGRARPSIVGLSTHRDVTADDLRRAAETIASLRKQGGKPPPLPAQRGAASGAGGVTGRGLASRPSSALKKYCEATSQPLSGRKGGMQVRSTTGSVVTR